MAFVDGKYRFIWASCGFPGNSHDAVILQSTDLWQQMKEGDFIPKIGKEVHGKTVPPLILGDSAFPFQTWLIKPYTNAVLTPKQSYFNYRLSRARMATEGAYGQLRACLYGGELPAGRVTRLAELEKLSVYMRPSYPASIPLVLIH